MDDRTATYYTQHAEEIAPHYDSVHPFPSQLACRVFDAGMRVLDVGCGSGRDVAQLLALGCDAYGVEPTAALRKQAETRHPELAGRLADAALPALGQPFGGNFDGVLCAAVLMHLPKSEILDAAISLRNVLKENGRLILSVPIDRPGLDWDHRDVAGRLFTPLAPDYLQLLFERSGFNLLEKWETPDAQCRAGHSWCTFLFQARHPGAIPRARAD
jgi:SAM-dependent methyltransferase